MQSPALSSETVVPMVVHTAGVVDAKLTTKPEVELAIKATGPMPSVCLPGETKVIVCRAVATAMVFSTGAAAA